MCAFYTPIKITAAKKEASSMMEEAEAAKAPLPSAKSSGWVGLSKLAIAGSRIPSQKWMTDCGCKQANKTENQCKGVVMVHTSDVICSLV